MKTLRVVTDLFAHSVQNENRFEDGLYSVNIRAC